jgi:cation-transporting P-type ATPase F
MSTSDSDTRTIDGQETADARSAAWYRRSVGEVFETLDVDDSGLSDDEVSRRLREHGPNRLREQTTVSAWRILFDQFTSPLVYVLVGALVVTIAIRSYSDAIVVAVVLVLNSTIGFFQEYRAETAVQSLMEMVSPHAVVRRGGDERQIDAEDIVPGDVVVLRQGAIVPADARLVETRGLRIDESTLTGESVPADKDTELLDERHLAPADQRNIAFMGTGVTSGEAVGVVVTTGTDTEMGQISEQIEEGGGTDTPLEMRIERLAKWITVGIFAVAAVAFGMGLLIGRSVDEMLLLAVALAVSAIPAGLPVVVTVALAIGVKRMADRNALIRQLDAVDTLGSCTTMLSDKTGTLTQNRMTVRAVTAGGKRFEFGEGDDADRLRLVGDDGHTAGRDVELDEHPALREALLVGVLCSDATLHNEATLSSEQRGRDDETDGDSGDPMEIALLRAGRQVGLERRDLDERHRQRDKVPFRTEQRFMATINDPDDEGDGPLVLVKGAPERIVEMCERQRTGDGGEEPLDGDAVLELSESLAAAGLRVLAMAVGCGDEAADSVHTEEPSGLVFVGMHGLFDPPRDSAIEAVRNCHEAGIRVLMVTGDHAATAAAIGTQVHIGAGAGDGAGEQPSVRTGQDIAVLSDEELDDVLASTSIYSRVAPTQKKRLVDRLKERDEVVAVTGDGVNDAPALQSAHIGAAMGSGTDVAKEVSELVITDDDFASVYAAVEEGRTAFRNIRMATFFLLSTGAAEVVLILVALGLDWPLPLLPAQILWLNVVTNGIADIALAFEPGEKSLFTRRPRPIDEGVLDRRLLERLVIVAIWLAAGTLGLFYWLWSVNGEELAVARTAALTTLVLFQTVHVFNCRSEDVSVFRKHLLTNKVLLFSLVSSAVHIAAMYVPWTQELLSLEPLSAVTWLVAIGVAASVVIVNEGHKRLRPRPITTASASR